MLSEKQTIQKQQFKRFCETNSCTAHNSKEFFLLFLLIILLLEPSLYYPALPKYIPETSSLKGFSMEKGVHGPVGLGSHAWPIPLSRI